MKVLLHCLFLCYSNQKKWINSVRSNWGKPWISQQYKMTSRNIRRRTRRIKTAPNQRWISSSTTARKYPQNVRKCRIMASTFGMFSQFFSIFRFGEVALEEGPSVHEEGIVRGETSKSEARGKFFSSFTQWRVCTYLLLNKLREVVLTQRNTSLQLVKSLINKEPIKSFLKVSQDISK